jgi:hypothetical protein
LKDWAAKELKAGGCFTKPDRLGLHWLFVASDAQVTIAYPPSIENRDRLEPLIS